MPTVTDQFHALGTTIEGGFRTDAATAHDLFSDVRQTIENFEQQFSRFRPASELSQVNQRAGQSLSVSESFLKLLIQARRMWTITQGLVDPTIGQALIAAGYDATFEETTQRSTLPMDRQAPMKASMADVAIDETQGTILLPRGVSLDFGGLGKGYLLDQLIPSIATVTENFWLSLGGDIFASGVDDDGQSWSIGVQDPQAHESDIARLRPPHGQWGIATSGTTKRRGTRSGTPWHHLIDPRTAQPSTTDIVAATVIAPTALEADVFAKAILLQGAEAGIDWAKHLSVEALVITQSGELKTTLQMRKYLRLL